MVSGAITYPAYLFADPKTALEWLVDVLDFQKLMVVEDAETGAIVHSEIKFGETVMMLGGLEGKKETPSGSYSYIGDVEALKAYAEQVKARGGKITKDVYHTHYDSNEFQVEGPEGTTFTFGDYSAHTSPCHPVYVKSDGPLD